MARYTCVPVEQKHYDHAQERNSSHCAIAMAIADAIPTAKFICVDLQTIRYTKKGLRYCFLTPHTAQDVIIATDQGEGDKLKPFTLKMRPAQISRAGKRRPQTPTNAELRGTGLGVAREQPHLRDSTADAPSQKRASPGAAPKEDSEASPAAPKSERYTATGERNLDPDRSDGLIGFGLSRPSWAARGNPTRKISTPRGRSVPTTLGGRLPPVSILSRREFGLRTAKR
jgi:hypothetical protein